jgi:hypothetical protein
MSRKMVVLVCVGIVAISSTCWSETLCRGEIPFAGDDEQDAALHVLAGASSALLAGAIAYPLVNTETVPGRAMAVAGIGVSTALLAGMLKEALDLCGFGDPDWRDLLLTLAGGVFAASGIYTLTCLVSDTSNKYPALCGLYGSVGVMLSLPVAENLCRRLNLSSEPRS